MKGVHPPRGIHLPAQGKSRLELPVNVELDQVVEEQRDCLAALDVGGERGVEGGRVGGEKVLQPGAASRIGAAARGERKQRCEQDSAH